MSTVDYSVWSSRELIEEIMKLKERVINLKINLKIKQNIEVDLCERELQDLMVGREFNWIFTTDSKMKINTRVFNSDLSK